MTELKQLLVAIVPNFIFLYETKIHATEFDNIRRKCKMEGCFVVDSVGCKGGLALLWNENTNMQVQSFSQNHIDALVNIVGVDRFRFSGFY